MTFIKSYSCTQRQLKSAINFIISVIVADYAFIVGGYTLAILIAGRVQKYRRQDGNDLLFTILINLGNYCEGCDYLIKHGSQGGETIPLQAYQLGDVDKMI